MKKGNFRIVNKRGQNLSGEGNRELYHSGMLKVKTLETRKGLGGERKGGKKRTMHKTLLQVQELPRLTKRKKKGGS